MNVWHRFKYESHKSYYFTATANLLILSLAIAISFIYDGFFFECFVSEKNLSSGSQRVQTRGFCYNVLQQFNRVDIDTAIINYAEWTTSIFLLLLLNLLTKRPHDCFRCLNKNPAAIYSLYQYPEFYQKGKSETRLGEESLRTVYMIDSPKLDEEVLIQAHSNDSNQRDLLYEYSGSVVESSDLSNNSR